MFRGQSLILDVIRTWPRRFRRKPAADSVRGGVTIRVVGDYQPVFVLVKPANNSFCLNSLFALIGLRQFEKGGECGEIGIERLRAIGLHPERRVIVGEVFPDISTASWVFPTPPSP